MKKVLFYYPSNKRSVQIETELSALLQYNVDFLLLTTCPKGSLHEAVEAMGIPTYAHPVVKSNAFIYYFKQILFLIKFCRKHKVDTVWANLQHVNFMAVFAQFFIPEVNVVCFRHHFKFNKGFKGIALQVNKTEVLFDRIINRFAKKIIVPSTGVYNGMQSHEKVNMNKVEIVPYIYDFSRYQPPQAERIKDVKERYPAQLRLIMCSRLIPFKRHQIVFPIIKKLVDEGLNLKMFVLDKGPEKERLEQYIRNNNLEQHIIMLGFRQDFMDFMGAADLLIHPSLTEASNNVVKEMGVMKKAVLVCKNVGDFDEYISDGVNGFFMPQENPEAVIEKTIRHVYTNKFGYNTIGVNLNKTILEKFNLSSTSIQKYLSLV